MKENERVECQVSALPCCSPATSAEPRRCSDCSTRAPARPRPSRCARSARSTIADLPPMIAEFLTRRDACATRRDRRGVLRRRRAGGRRRRELTNVPWPSTRARSRRRSAFGRVSLLNDLEAMAYAVPVLERRRSSHVLQEGDARRGGNIALIAAGTGLGRGAAAQRRWPVRAVAVRGGTRRLRRADRARDRAAAGAHGALRARRRRARRLGPRAGEHPPASRTGRVRGRHRPRRSPTRRRPSRRRPWPGAAPACVETLDLFVEAYGAEAGNLALRSVATGGVFVGGGIAPKILPALERRRVHARVPREGAARAAARRDARCR